MVNQITLAVEKLRNGDVVGIPTETVYGLAAMISNNEAIKKIFKTKQRPFFDPLIVHVSGFKQATELISEWGDAIEVLTVAFWPGPLTLVVPKKNVNDLVTSGLQTVGIRCPAHKIALEIIENVGEPLAAPSANRFGKTSPTSAKHVIHEFNNDIFVVDGGSCSVGIESTIISVFESTTQIEISVLRTGLITPSQISYALKKLNKQIVFIKPSNKIVAPGQIEHHYMPSKPILWVSRELLGADCNSEAIRNVNATLNFNSPCELKLNLDASLAARELYSQMRICSEGFTDLIVCVKEPFQLGEEWDSIFDRISRASSFKFLNKN
jgi:L-threonylcarbamoyladenylate synthase